MHNHFADEATDIPVHWNKKSFTSSFPRNVPTNQCHLFCFCAFAKAEIHKHYRCSGVFATRKKMEQRKMPKGCLFCCFTVWHFKWLTTYNESCNNQMRARNGSIRRRTLVTSSQCGVDKNLTSAFCEGWVPVANLLREIQSCISGACLPFWETFMKFFASLNKPIFIGQCKSLLIWRVFCSAPFFLFLFFHWRRHVEFNYFLQAILCQSVDVNFVPLSFSWTRKFHVSAATISAYLWWEKIVHQEKKIEKKLYCAILFWRQTNCHFELIWEYVERQMHVRQEIKQEGLNVVTHRVQGWVYGFLAVPMTWPGALVVSF